MLHALNMKNSSLSCYIFSISCLVKTYLGNAKTSHLSSIVARHYNKKNAVRNSAWASLIHAACVKTVYIFLIDLSKSKLQSSKYSVCWPTHLAWINLLDPAILTCCYTRKLWTALADLPFLRSQPRKAPLLTMRVLDWSSNCTHQHTIDVHMRHSLWSLLIRCSPTAYLG